MSLFTPQKSDRFTFGLWTLQNNGRDPFGEPTRPGYDPLTMLDKLADLGVYGVNLHDHDLLGFGKSIAEQDSIIAAFKQRLHDTGLCVPMATTNLFTHPIFRDGAFTSNDPKVRAFALQKTMRSMDVGNELGAKVYVFWGGREGYASLVNTDMKREVAHFARFLTVARDYGRSIGLKGNFLIEPKPMEPMKHQYDFDSATVAGFLKEHGLEKDFKLNIEANHATLSGHTFEHDLQVASDHGLLGSIDANRGNAQNGWDTDQFPTDLYDTVGAMLVVLRQGGLEGGLNFDAKVRRESTDLEDLFIAHVGGMDAFARGLEVAHALLNDSPLEQWRKERYASFDSGAGKDFAGGALSLAELAALGAKGGEPRQISGKQERYENLLNQYLLR